MKTVLLAIEGGEQHGAVMSFARQFCRKMDVALDIVYVMGPGQEMPAAPPPPVTDGGAGAPAKPDDLHLLTSENPPRAIEKYIDSHRNIVLAIFDGRTGNRKEMSGTQTGDIPMGFEKPLAVPLVVMRS